MKPERIKEIIESEGSTMVTCGEVYSLARAAERANRLEEIINKALAKCDELDTYKGDDRETWSSYHEGRSDAADLISQVLEEAHKALAEGAEG